MKEELKRIAEHYRSHNTTSKHWRMKQGERDLVLARLKDGYTVEAIKMAIDGLHMTDWNIGKNPNGMMYLDMYYALSEDKIDKRIRTAELHARDIERSMNKAKRVSIQRELDEISMEMRIGPEESLAKRFRNAQRKKSGKMN
jgi:hypothetical protein|tara:strand:+ start:61 stop:486 length:426 start_codon:yes stop_codon:yes gene_type:complete